MGNSFPYLTPIEVKEPPLHTQPVPQCFTCEHFPICTMRGDYLKTMQLVQNILGNPQQDLCLHKANYDMPCPCYEGEDIENADTIFPAELTFAKRILPSGEEIDLDVVGTFESAKYQDYDHVLFMYDSEGYKVEFKAIYNKITQEFDISNGTEIVYGIVYTFPTDHILEVQVELGAWRDDMIAKEEESKDIDIINTTYFTADLKCRFFNPVRGLTPAEGLRRIFAEFPHGIPCGDGQYYHIETLHVEPGKVPWWNPNAGKVAFAPMPYPVFIPEKCKRKDCLTRDERSHDDF